MRSNKNNIRASIGLSTKIVAVISLIIFVMVGCLTIISIQSSKKLAVDLIRITTTEKLHGDLFSSFELLEKIHGSVSLQGGQLVDGTGNPLANNYKLVDTITDKLGAVATVFNVDGDDYTRVITSIKNAEGARVIGTKLGKESAAYPSMREGKDYFGVAKILGKSYYTAYSPLKSKNGDIIGILFIGVSFDQADTVANTSIFGITVSIILAALGLFALTIIGIIVFSRMQIIKPLKTAVQYIGKLSKGDLSLSPPPALLKRGDELSSLGSAIGSLSAELRNIVSGVYESIDQVASSSVQLSTTAGMLSQGATEQASSVEEISSSMEEMMSTIRMNADNAKTTELIARKSAKSAEEGGYAVGQTVNAMKDIAAKITIIEEIARSTNMLALNASIEAARAGEYGKGFSVVASEVGKLAERSQKESAEINKLSHESLITAEGARATISEMVPEIKHTAELVQEISASCNEQNTGAEQINESIIQLDLVVQQNASSSEESASMAEELAGQVDQIRDMIQFFVLE